MELTSENSPLPDDIVYGLDYNSQNNSLMISTDKGLAEYFISGQFSSEDKEDIKAFPNPVRPEFMGYVTIEGVPEGALVKIADGAGNVVKELGRSSGFETKWDVTNHQHKRVASGVYYILVSSGYEDVSFSSVGKILVVN